MLKNYIRVIKTMSITCTVNLNCHKLSTEFIKLDYKWDFLNFFGKIWNTRVFSLLFGAHYASGLGPRGPSWCPLQNKKKLEFFYSGIHIGGRAPSARARVGPKALSRASGFPVGPIIWKTLLFYTRLKSPTGQRFFLGIFDKIIPICKKYTYL